MTTLDNFDFNGKKALVRVDFNVPLNNKYQITDETRLTAAVPTIKKIINDGGSVILMSHLGRPKGEAADKFSLRHIVDRLAELLGTPVLFSTDCVGAEAEDKAASLKRGEVLLLENLRFHKEETAGDTAFAQQLAKLGDVYVNDAFGTAHRAHASTAIVADYFEQKVCGYVIQAELNNAQKVLDKPERPFTAIMGGAKISDKILIIEKLLDKVDNLLIGGGMAYTFFKAMDGSIGKSLVEEEKLDLAKKLIKMAKDKNVNLELPVDSVCGDRFDNDANEKICKSFLIEDDYMGLDIGPEAREVYTKIIKESKTILWNGPMGVFEMSNFAMGTEKVAEAVVEATQGGAYSLIGGGDSAAAVNSLGYGEEVSYVSTGGGALLEYMEGKELPGIKALKK